MSLTWKEFLIPDTGRSVTCSTGNGLCLLRFDAPFSNYTVIVKKEGEKPQLLNNTTGKTFDLVALSSDGRKYGLKSKTGDEQSINFDVDFSEDKTAVIVHNHSFNFYHNEGVMTMDKEHTASLLKIPNKLRIGESHGYGVFASADIKAGEIVEEAVMLAQTDPYLTNYTFGFNKLHLLALGLGSLYNHSDTPNIGHSISSQGNVITFTALRDIPEGTQCTISYGPAYFSSRGLVADPI